MIVEIVVQDSLRYFVWWKGAVVCKDLFMINPTAVKVDVVS